MLLTIIPLVAFPMEPGASVHPLAVAVSFIPDIYNGEWVGFTAHASFEYRFVKPVSWRFTFRYWSDRYSRDWMMSYYSFDHYTDSAFEFGTGFKVYPLAVVGIDFFVGVDVFAYSRSLVFPGSATCSVWNAYFNASLGYRWALFGESGPFLQPSINLNIPLTVAALNNPYFILPMPGPIPYVFLELGWVF